MAKKELVQLLISHKVLVTKEMLQELETPPTDYCLHELLSHLPSSRPELFSKINFSSLSQKFDELIKQEGQLEAFIRYVSGSENQSLSQLLTDFLNQKTTSSSILETYDKPSKKWVVNDFVQYFTKRFKTLSTILRNRPELSHLTSISHIKNRPERERTDIIGMVTEKNITRNNNIILRVEDQTGNINVVISKSKLDIFEAAKDITLDEVIGITGVNGKNVIFANSLIWPDIPHNTVSKSPLDENAIFISDTHFGSKKFLKAEFEKFIEWLHGNVGDEQQRKEAKKVKYLIIMGDVVDGVGIYPNQDNDLEIPDIYDQYAIAAEYLSRIPTSIQIYVSPGNHDAVRIAEPQPAFNPEYAKPMLELPNVVAVSNPATVSIGKTPTFSGISVLIYHGYSFDYYFANVESIRNQGGYDRADLMLKYLLKRRHLAPTHTSTLYLPDAEEDPLVIKQVPDIFASGHIHKSTIANYRGVTLISGSCWQATTDFQEKLGHKPEPCRVPMINLKTRETKMLRFT